MIPHIFKRNFQEGLVLPDVEWTVRRYSKHVYGGPRSATLEAHGDDVELWELLELLRCPIHILNDNGEVVWWGLIASLELVARNPNNVRGSRVKIGADIDSMRNRVAIAFTLVDLVTGDQERATTDYADDLESQAEYGIKELLDSRSAATLEHAEAARDKTLADLKYPITVVEPNDRGSESKAVVECIGWWQTLGWRYYINLDQTSVDTAQQVKDIIDTEGEFIGTVYLDDTSGISISEERDGDATALYEATELLELGTVNFRRLLAEVDVNRNVRVYEEPTANEGVWKLNADGSMATPYGEEVRKDTCPVGMWVVQGDMIPPSLESIYLSDPNLKFIDQMEYDVEADDLIPTAKDAPDPWDFPIVKPG